MSANRPFLPQGRCENCKFSSALESTFFNPAGFFLQCSRYPPNGIEHGTTGFASVHRPVMSMDYCVEWRSDDPE